jgi:assimilatory nitrate reductase electron transfer subunit
VSERSERTSEHSASVVVVGNGMAGARFAAELRSREPRRPVVVFGTEPGRAYNRILLSNLLAGKVGEEDLALAEPPGALDLRTGVDVDAIDPEAKTVHASDGTTTRYDTLVLATGSRAIVPPIDGLWKDPETLIDGAETFRTLADCRRIIAEAEQARKVVVLGGGLLGLEAARGLAQRGLAIEVVHARGHLMERQIDPDASRILISTLAELGVSVRLDAVTEEVIATEPGGGGRLRGVRLEDGSEIEADLLVIACGVRPNPDLAAKAGLLVNHGIVVDDRMRTSDPSVYAIGECAEHRGKVYGLVQPAWEQARVAAEVISGGGGAHYTGSRLVTRLKASGVDLASMGDPHVDADGAEVVTFADPTRRTYQKVVIRDQRVVAAILLGDSPTVGTLTQAFDRETPVPSDPRSLLFTRGGGQAAEPGMVSAATTLCRCNGVTAGAIVRAWMGGARTPTEVAGVTRASTGCGSCRDTIASYVTALAADAQQGGSDSAASAPQPEGVVA